MQLYQRPLLEAVGKDARQGRAAVEGAALRHQLDDTVAVLRAVRCGASGAAVDSGWLSISFHIRNYIRWLHLPEDPTRMAKVLNTHFKLITPINGYQNNIMRK